MTKEDIVADIRNKLGPFWTLIDLMTMPVELWEDRVDEHSVMMEECAILAYQNRNLITEKLDELLK